MKRRLEFKVLAVVVTLLVVGIISAAFITVSTYKTILYSVTELATEKTANIIYQDIEATMLEGKADVTKKLVGNIRKTGGIENITVLNSEGQEAFREGSPAQEAAALGELKSGKERVLIREKTRLIFYMPLRNIPSCHTCHGQEKPILGAVRVSISLEREYGKAMALIARGIVVAVIACLAFCLVLWVMLRKLVIKPVKSIEAAAASIADGDLSFNVANVGEDEIGRVSELLKQSFHSLERVLQRIKELSERIVVVADDINKESEKVIRGAEAEAEATSNISSSVEELNATTAGIADSTEDLARSAEDTSASIAEMVSSINTVNNSVQELNGIVGSTSVSIEQLAASTKEVAIHAEELAGASEETLSAISEITATIKEVSGSAKESARLSEKAMNEAATLGMTSIAKTMEGMREIQSSAVNTAECMSLLGKRSIEIEMILDVISSINDETELLALNASILAAQAGEHGRGFSVVADEIRALARRTKKSTGEITPLIEAVRREVENATSATQIGIASVSLGLRLAQEAEDALKRILDSSKKSSEMTSSIERTTEEQAKAVNLVTEATERVRNMIGYIARTTAEQSQGVILVMEAADRMSNLSSQVSRAMGEQAQSNKQIEHAIEIVSERSQQISKSLVEHKKGSKNILGSVEAVKDIPVENRDRALKIGKTLWNLQKDTELLKAEMERFKFSGDRGYSLRFGVVPLKEPSIMFRKFTPLSEYLSDKLGRKVDLRVAIDMDSAVDDIGENITQLCAMGPANYVEAKKKFDLTVIVKALRKGKPFHRAAIIVKDDSDIHSVRDLKGKNFAFVSPQSATGHIMPLVTLKDAGLVLEDLSYYEFLKQHEEVARAVLNGEFDAGGLMEETAVEYREKGLRILQLSPEIPEFNICCNSFVDNNTRLAIKNALTSLDVSKASDAEVLGSLGKDCTGFVPADEKDYNIFREKTFDLSTKASADTYLHRRNTPKR